MSVRRQYSLPNVALTLDGWSDETAPDGQAALSIVTDVECRFLPQQQVLKGGKELLDALIAASSYVQDFLSDLHLKPTAELKAGQLRLGPTDRSGYHRLVWQPPAGDPGKNDGDRVEFELSTVQLFDLVEAVDQFSLDSTTLPAMTFSVAPRPAGARQPDRPLAQRATPAALGVASFAAIAGLLFVVPVPEMRDPEAERLEESEVGVAATNALPAGITAALADVPRMTEPVELIRLSRQVKEKVDAAWRERGLVREIQNYRVWATPEGELVGFESVDRDLAAADAPVLPTLLALQIDPSELASVAEFQMTFNGSGIVEVGPWRDGDAAAETETAE